MKRVLLFLFLFAPAVLFAQQLKIVINHVGYEVDGAKKAIALADNKLPLVSFQLIDANSNAQVYSGSVTYSGPVSKWKNWKFWTMDFSAFNTPGSYKVQVVL